jgi:tetratricopeptide (TPR) repeat protein
MAGRYEDALRVLERLPLENYTRFSWILRSAIYAELGRSEDAKIWLAKALAKYPQLTIEGFINEPGWSGSERRRMMDAMQHAGFPPCVLPGQLDGVASPIRIPECVSLNSREESGRPR